MLDICINMEYMFIVLKSSYGALEVDGPATLVGSKGKSLPCPFAGESAMYCFH